MSTRFRTLFAVLMIGAALIAAAAAPTRASGRPGSSGDFAGSWITWWDIGGEMSPCSRMVVAPESETTLDGMWAAPGWNGLLHGTVEQTRGGLRWSGEWRDENGAGGFRFVLGAPGAPANRFQGTYTTEGSTEELSWNGEREVNAKSPTFPAPSRAEPRCGFSGACVHSQRVRVRGCRCVRRAPRRRPSSSRG